MAPRTLPRTFPLGPLIALIPPEPGHKNRASPTSKLARTLGLTPRSALRWVTVGALTAPLADRAAAALGLHPLHVWPDEWAAELDRPAIPRPRRQHR